ncbi:HTH-type transcriptional repressor AseR [Aedoeadaptatus ivorii]|uniref:HTH-type transcriptional repressor AseR n=1 Tax=Aedoeadaptatus ivorii TaxID=54006 RepID=A0A448V0J1_9FIRM|nr:metalloregulator ArsR/SmtB family transcription factor [Peptoniphilus ivorii]MDQ0508988.1 ArsR family transcriptional regulator [Peptoniphilus ivorii]VEJ35032.1 HTH-type transcriptional repressor AseR [Peptoniphilus ivorii]
MREKKQQDMVEICKALGDLNRLKIMQYLIDGEACACDILPDLDITQPTLSHHMKILSRAGLIDDRKEGKWHFYTINAEVIREFQQFLAQVARSKVGHRKSSRCLGLCCGGAWKAE